MTSSAGASRLRYPYSVIPGGVGSSFEMMEAIHRDRIVASHYAALRLARLRVLRNARERLVHVSYRQGQNVYWTRNKVRISAGEIFLDDGATAVRARCGNQISELALEPTAPNEPSEEELNTPQEWEGIGWVEPIVAGVPDYLLMPIELEETTAGFVPQTETVTIMPVVAGPVWFPSEEFRQSEKPGSPDQFRADTPEPASFFLALAGLLIVFARHWRRRYFAELRDFSHLSVSERRRGENCSIAPFR